MRAARAIQCILAACLVLHGTGALHAWHLHADHDHDHGPAPAARDAHRQDTSHAHLRHAHHPCHAAHTDEPPLASPAAQPAPTGDHHHCAICDLLTAPRELPALPPSTPVFGDRVEPARVDAIGHFPLELAMRAAGPRAPPTG